MEKINIFWFRRDLRLHDNTGLYHALTGGHKVLPVFIFDTTILKRLSNPFDARVEFIHKTLFDLKKQLHTTGHDIEIYHDTPVEAFKKICKRYAVATIYTNTDYEPAALERDQVISDFAQQHGIDFKTFKDQVIFEKNEILNETNKPYKVYTPYKNKWLKKLADFPVRFFPSEKYSDQFLKQPEGTPMPALESLGFKPTSIVIPPIEVARQIIISYDKTRDYPFLEKGTSLLGIHFRFGTISVREKMIKALPLNNVWVSELIWREFFMQLLYHFPYVVSASFQTKFNVIEWRYSEEDFAKWCAGETGYPLVDAGMRELNATGHMHNRVRMVVASFLTKHLFIDWRWGEAYFAEKLLDYDLSANNGNWQWAAGTGADAQPYFRIFNPIAQQEKFDPDFIYIKKWIPEYGTSSYIQPIIDHKKAVERAKRLFSVLKTS